MTTAQRFNARLEVADLALARGGRLIVADASFDLAPGETVLLNGPNGAGKTSLLRAVAGLLPIAAGRVSVFHGAAREPAGLKSQCVYVGHADGVKSAMTGAEHLRFWSALYGAPDDRIEDAIAAFDLGAFAAARAGALSAGQRRRLGLARLVISGKPLWLMDEPTAAIDDAAADRLVALIKTHMAAGGGALIATHDKIAIGARVLRIEAAGGWP